MPRMYLVVGWGILLLGAVHMLAAAWIFAGFTPRALWFVGAGLGMVLLGALNLLNRTYGSRAAGLKRVCVAANVAMTIFGITGGVVSKGDAAQFVLVLGLVGGATVLSLMGRALVPIGVAKS